MKKLKLFVAVAIVAMLFTSCRKEDYKSFIGTWGVEKIEYYNIDFAGNPIPGSLETYNYDPESTDNGIQLYFRKDRTGEMRDSARDTIWIENEETGEYDYIYNPDTVLVSTFTYSYDKDDHALYMNVEGNARPYRLEIEDLTFNSFIYENEYYSDYVEKSYLKRISKTANKDNKRQSVARPFKPGSFLGGR
jgi:hypothetical protein